MRGLELKAVFYFVAIFPVKLFFVKEVLYSRELTLATYSRGPVIKSNF